MTSGGEMTRGETSWGQNDWGRKWFGGETTRIHLKQVWGISENSDHKLSLEHVTMNSPCKGKSIQTTVYWVDQ